MRTLLYFSRINYLALAIFLFALAGQAQAGVFDRDWVDDEINTVKDQVSDVFGKTGPMHNRIVNQVTPNVNAIKDRIEGKVPGTVPYKLKEQLGDLNDKGQLLKESIKEILVYIKNRQGPYADFVGDLNNKCADGSECFQFRADLRSFVRDFSALSDRFPIIEKTRFSNADQIIEKFVDLPPPVVLWGFHEVWERTPILQQLPMELELIFEELNDPELFSLELAGAHNFILSRPQLSLAKFKQVAATDRFCDRSINQNSWDPIRLNRILFILGYIKSGLDYNLQLFHDDLNLSLVGEGSATPVASPIGVFIGLAKFIVEVIELAIETRFKNLEICDNLRGADNGGAQPGGGNGNNGGGNGNSGGGNGNPANFGSDGNFSVKDQLMLINIIQREISNYSGPRAYGQVAERVNGRMGE